MIRTIGSIGALAVLAGSASAQLVVGNDQSGTASMYYVDVNTGVSTSIYSASDASAKPWGMAYDPGSNTLYWNNGSNLYSSPFDVNGLSPTLLGGMTFNGSTVNFVGLGFRDGMLVGTRNISTEAVYEIDVNSLVANQTYVYSSSFDFGGVDVDWSDSSLYGLSDAGGSGLYLIDDLNQNVTFKAPYPAGETDIDGLAVYNGLAYYVTDGPNSSQANFYVFDVASGSQVGTLPSPFTGSGVFAAAAYIVPAPGALAAL
ncbi:MAG: hypothetical protein K8E66_06940, partial [Phycisphaerales bacterium]|nr:hypothetical protein [Phycisphaerales bacterium]